MEIMLEISKEEAEELNISFISKITLKELNKRMAMLKMRKALKESHEIAKDYGIDEWTMEDVNNIIKEAKEEYKKANEKDSH